MSHVTYEWVMKGTLRIHGFIWDESVCRCLIWSITYEYIDSRNRMQVSHMKCHIWSVTYEVSHMKCHIWSHGIMKLNAGVTYEVSYMKYHIWGVTCEYMESRNYSYVSHMKYHIWIYVHICLGADGRVAYMMMFMWGHEMNDLLKHDTCEWVMSHINESCHMWMSHVTHQWVMSHVNVRTRDERVTNYMWDERPAETCHMWMSHVTHQKVMSYITWTPDERPAEACHMWMSHVTREWVMSHVNESCHMWMSHMWMSHVTCEWVMSHVIWMNHIIMWHDSLIRVPWLLYFPLALPHLHTSAVACMSESRHTYEWTMSMSHVTHQWVISYTKGAGDERPAEARDVWMSHVTCEPRVQFVTWLIHMVYTRRELLWHLNLSCHELLWHMNEPYEASLDALCDCHVRHDVKVHTYKSCHMSRTAVTYESCHMRHLRWMPFVT